MKKNNPEPISVYEYERLTVGDKLNKKDFEALRSFILKQEEEGINESVPFDELKTEEAGACMKLSASHGQEVLTVKNYVGTILLSTGTTIEILPKTFKADENEKTARNLVVAMLKKCGLISHKAFQKADINALKNLTIFEVYIRVFLDEVFALYKKGLKSGYEQKQDNEKFFKGKLVFSQHIKHNFAHAERFFVEYEEFTVNRPENRLIKTTLAFLRGISRVDTNRRDLHRLTMIFDDVEKSTHIQSDFQKCTGGRNMKEYETVLSLCKVFLNGYGFSTYAGKHNTIALLFPMEKLFEGYIAKQLKEKLEESDWTVTSQSQKLHLFTEPKMFSLRPDVYLENGNKVILLDTKWKALTNKKAENYGISQADMYQMFAYYYRYTQSLVGSSKQVMRVILAYPMVSGFEGRTIVGEWKIENEIIVSAHLIPYGKGNDDDVFDLSELIDELTKIK